MPGACLRNARNTRRPRVTRRRSGPARSSARSSTSAYGGSRKTMSYVSAVWRRNVAASPRETFALASKPVARTFRRIASMAAGARASYEADHVEQRPGIARAQPRRDEQERMLVHAVLDAREDRAADRREVRAARRDRLALGDVSDVRVADPVLAMDGTDVAERRAAARDGERAQRRS